MSLVSCNVYYHTAYSPSSALSSLHLDLYSVFNRDIHTHIHTQRGREGETAGQNLGPKTTVC